MIIYSLFILSRLLINMNFFYYIRSNYDDNIYLYKINNINYISNVNEPTICISLFNHDENINLNNINNLNLAKFFKSEIYILIKFLLSLRFYLPSGNIILYIDSNLINLFETKDNEKINNLNYLLNKIFKSKLSYLLNNIDDELNKFIESIIIKLKKYQNYNFDNFFNKFLFFLTFICFDDYSENNLKSPNYLTIYDSKCKFLPLIITKNRYKHLIWKNYYIPLTKIDKEWILKFNELGKINKDKLFILPIDVGSNIDNNIIQEELIQIYNFSDSEFFLDEEYHKKILLLLELFESDNKLLLELINANKNKIIYIKKCILLNILNINLEDYNEIYISYFLLFLYLYDNNQLITFDSDNNKISLRKFINSVEILRKLYFSINFKYLDKILILLSIAPTIYNITNIYSSESDIIYEIDEIIDKILNIFDEIYDVKVKKDKLYKLYSSKKILSKLKIYWTSSLINNSFEFKFKIFEESNNYNFYPGLYLPGIYNFIQPNNICILRSPKDLKHAYIVNKKGSIELTDYKFINETTLSKIIKKLNINNFHNINKGIIKKDIIAKILNVDIKIIKKRLYSSIIWRILLINNYNIPVEFIRLTKKLKINIMNTFNLINIVYSNMNKKNYIVKLLFNE